MKSKILITIINCFLILGKQNSTAKEFKMQNNSFSTMPTPNFEAELKSSLSFENRLYGASNFEDWGGDGGDTPNPEIDPTTSGKAPIGDYPMIVAFAVLMYIIVIGMREMERKKKIVISNLLKNPKSNRI